MRKQHVHEVMTFAVPVAEQPGILCDICHAPDAQACDALFSHTWTRHASKVRFYHLDCSDPQSCATDPTWQACGDRWSVTRKSAAAGYQLGIRTPETA